MSGQVRQELGWRAMEVYFNGDEMILDGLHDGQHQMMHGDLYQILIPMPQQLQPTKQRCKVHARVDIISRHTKKQVIL